MKLPLEVLNLYPAHDYTLSGAYASRRVSCGHKPFLLFAGMSLSWDKFGTDVAKLAQAFHARGVRSGDRVAIMARNHVGHVLTLFAVARLGAIMVPVNPDFGVEEARCVLAELRARTNGDMGALVVSAVIADGLAARAHAGYRDPHAER